MSNSLNRFQVNILREKLMAELKADVVHGHHRNEESFENAKKRYLYVKENFNKQVNKVRDNLVRQKEAEEEYDSSVYKDEDEDDEEEEHEGELIPGKQDGVGSIPQPRC